MGIHAGSEKVRLHFAPSCPLFLLFTVLVIAYSGCHSKTPEVAPVKGKVLLDDQPLKTGRVLTTPAAGRGSNGLIEPDGSFQLSTYGDRDGARIGIHKVAIVAYEGGGTGPEDDPGKLLVPRQYTSPESSGLTIEVTEDGPNEPVLELSSK